MKYLWNCDLPWANREEIFIDHIYAFEFFNTPSPPLKLYSTSAWENKYSRGVYIRKRNSNTYIVYTYILIF